MQVGCHTRHAPVDFFRKWLPFVMCAQPGFHVPNPDPPVIGCQGRRHHRGCIALHQHPIGGKFSQHRIQAGKNRRRQLRQCLVRLHQIQVKIRQDLEQVQHLVEHLAMLSRYTYTGFDPGCFGQAAHHRRHFHRFRPGAKNRQDAQLSYSQLLSDKL